MDAHELLFGPPRSPESTPSEHERIMREWIESHREQYAYLVWRHAREELGDHLARRYHAGLSYGDIHYNVLSDGRIFWGAKSPAGMQAGVIGPDLPLFSSRALRRALIERL